MQQELWSTQKESASLLERATSKYFTFLSGALLGFSAAHSARSQIRSLTQEQPGGLWLRLRIRQRARQQEKGKEQQEGSESLQDFIQRKPDPFSVL